MDGWADQARTFVALDVEGTGMDPARHECTWEGRPVKLTVTEFLLLQALAQRINADAVAAGAPDPGYQTYLEEGNDVGGIDVGFLVKAGEVDAGLPRVEVLSVRQIGAKDTWTYPGDGSTSLLNDRPPLVLDARVNFGDGRDLPVTVVAVHQRSLSGIEDDGPGSNGWATAGQRVRDKRQKQAEFLATLIPWPPSEKFRCISPSGPISRPTPERRNPPKGLRGSTMIPEFTAQVPVRMRPATATPRSRSAVHTDPESPKSESLARATAWSTSS